MSAPLVASSMLNLVLFSVTGATRQLVHPDPTTPIALHEVIVASWMTAPIYVAFVTPVELIKVAGQLRGCRCQDRELMHIFSPRFD